MTLLNKLDRPNRVWFIISAGMVLVIATLVVAVVGLLHANHASNQALAGCQLYKTVAEAPLAPTTTAFGLQLSVGARTAYYSADCALGRLAPADTRVAPLLPPGVH